jgi:hypothetical protein
VALGQDGRPTFGADSENAPSASPPKSGVSNALIDSAVFVQRVLKEFQRIQRTELRELLIEPNRNSRTEIEPNRNSRTEIERYDFSLNQSFVLGTPIVIDMSCRPSVTLRAQRFICNAPAPGFVSFLAIMMANIAITVGDATDAFSYSASANSHFDCPTLSPANKAQIKGVYSGLTPPGYSTCEAFLFCATFQGPATIVA